MQNEQIITVVDQCIELFKSARGSVVEAMPLLHQIQKENLWESRYSSFGEFLDECGISRSQASRLLKVFEHYSGVSQLNSVDPERLYLALKLPGTPEEHFEKAKALSRNELKSEAAVHEDGSEHEHVPVTICKVCGVRL